MCCFVLLQSDSAFRQLRSQFYGYIFDDAWYSHIRQLVGNRLPCTHEKFNYYSELVGFFVLS